MNKYLIVLLLICSFSTLKGQETFSTKKWTIKPTYVKTFPFREGVAFVIQRKYNERTYNHDSTMVFRNHHEELYILDSLTDRLSFVGLYEPVYPFTGGYAVIKDRYDFFYYVDKKGNILLKDLKLVYATPFYNGLALIVSDKKRKKEIGGSKSFKTEISTINKNREIINTYSNVYCSACDGYTSYVEVMSMLKYNLIPIEKNRNHTAGYIRLNGSVAIPFDYSVTNKFNKKGIAQVTIRYEDKVNYGFKFDDFYIDTLGNRVDNKEKRATNGWDNYHEVVNKKEGIIEINWTQTEEELFIASHSFSVESTTSKNNNSLTEIPDKNYNSCECNNTVLEVNPDTLIKGRNLLQLGNPIGIYDKNANLRSVGYFLEIDTTVKSGLIPAKDLDGYWGYIDISKNLRSEEEAIKADLLFYETAREGNSHLISISDKSSIIPDWQNILSSQFGFERKEIILNHTKDLYDRLTAFSHLSKYREQLIIHIKGDFNNDGFGLNSSTPVNDRIPINEFTSLFDRLAINHVLIFVEGKNSLSILKSNEMILGGGNPFAHKNEKSEFQLITEQFKSNSNPFKRMILIDEVSNNEELFFKSFIEVMDCANTAANSETIWYYELQEKVWSQPENIAQFRLLSDERNGKGNFIFIRKERCGE